MYYEEKMIDGRLMCRSIPDGEWHPVSAQSLIERVENLSCELDRLRAVNARMLVALKHCLLEHGGYTIRGETERIIREAIATAEQSTGEKA